MWILSVWRLGGETRPASRLGRRAASFAVCRCSHWASSSLGVGFGIINSFFWYLFSVSKSSQPAWSSAKRSRSRTIVRNQKLTIPWLAVLNLVIHDFVTIPVMPVSKSSLPRMALLVLPIGDNAKSFVMDFADSLAILVNPNKPELARRLPPRPCSVRLAVYMEALSDSIAFFIPKRAKTMRLPIDELRLVKLLPVCVPRHPNTSEVGWTSTRFVGLISRFFQRCVLGCCCEIRGWLVLGERSRRQQENINREYDARFHICSKRATAQPVANPPQSQ